MRAGLAADEGDTRRFVAKFDGAKSLSQLSPSLDSNPHLDIQPQADVLELLHATPALEFEPVPEELVTLSKSPGPELESLKTHLLETIKAWLQPYHPQLAAKIDAIPFLYIDEQDVNKLGAYLSPKQINIFKASEAIYWGNHGAVIVVARPSSNLYGVELSIAHEIGHHLLDAQTQVMKETMIELWAKWIVDLSHQTNETLKPVIQAGKERVEHLQAAGTLDQQLMERLDQFLALMPIALSEGLPEEIRPQFFSLLWQYGLCTRASRGSELDSEIRVKATNLFGQLAVLIDQHWPAGTFRRWVHGSYDEEAIVGLVREWFGGSTPGQPGSSQLPQSGIPSGEPSVLFDANKLEKTMGEVLALITPAANVLSFESAESQLRSSIARAIETCKTLGLSEGFRYEQLACHRELLLIPPQNDSEIPNQRLALQALARTFRLIDLLTEGKSPDLTEQALAYLAALDYLDWQTEQRFVKSNQANLKHLKQSATACSLFEEYLVTKPNARGGLSQKKLQRVLDQLLQHYQDRNLLPSKAYQVRPNNPAVSKASTWVKDFVDMSQATSPSRRPLSEATAMTVTQLQARVRDTIKNTCQSLGIIIEDEQKHTSDWGKHCEYVLEPFVCDTVPATFYHLEHHLQQIGIEIGDFTAPIPWKLQVDDRTLPILLVKSNSVEPENEILRRALFTQFSALFTPSSVFPLQLGELLAAHLCGQGIQDPGKPLQLIPWEGLTLDQRWVNSQGIVDHVGLLGAACQEIILQIPEARRQSFLAEWLAAAIDPRLQDEFSRHIVQVLPLPIVSLLEDPSVFSDDSRIVALIRALQNPDDGGKPTLSIPHSVEVQSNPIWTSNYQQVEIKGQSVYLTPPMPAVNLDPDRHGKIKAQWQVIQGDLSGAELFIKTPHSFHKSLGSGPFVKMPGSLNESLISIQGLENQMLGWVLYQPNPTRASLEGIYVERSQQKKGIDLRLYQEAHQAIRAGGADRYTLTANFDLLKLVLRLQHQERNFKIYDLSNDDRREISYTQEIAAFERGKPLEVVWEEIENDHSLVRDELPETSNLQPISPRTATILERLGFTKPNEQQQVTELMGAIRSARETPGMSNDKQIRTELDINRIRSKSAPFEGTIRLKGPIDSYKDQIIGWEHIDEAVRNRDYRKSREIVIDPAMRTVTLVYKNKEVIVPLDIIDGIDMTVAEISQGGSPLAEPNSPFKNLDLVLPHGCRFGYFDSGRNIPFQIGLEFYPESVQEKIYEVMQEVIKQNLNTSLELAHHLGHRPLISGSDLAHFSEALPSLKQAIGEQVVEKFQNFIQFALNTYDSEEIEEWLTLVITEKIEALVEKARDEDPELPEENARRRENLQWYDGIIINRGEPGLPYWVKLSVDFETEEIVKFVPVAGPGGSVSDQPTHLFETSLEVIDPSPRPESIKGTEPQLPKKEIEGVTLIGLPTPTEIIIQQPGRLDIDPDQLIQNIQMLLHFQKSSLFMAASPALKKAYEQKIKEVIFSQSRYSARLFSASQTPIAQWFGSAISHQHIKAPLHEIMSKLRQASKDQTESIISVSKTHLTTYPVLETILRDNPELELKVAIADSHLDVFPIDSESQVHNHLHEGNFLTKLLKMNRQRLKVMILGSSYSTFVGDDIFSRDQARLITDHPNLYVVEGLDFTTFDPEKGVQVNPVKMKQALNKGLTWLWAGSKAKNSHLYFSLDPDVLVDLTGTNYNFVNRLYYLSQKRIVIDLLALQQQKRSGSKRDQADQLVSEAIGLLDANLRLPLGPGLDTNSLYLATQIILNSAQDNHIQMGVPFHANKKLLGDIVELGGPAFDTQLSEALELWVAQLSQSLKEPKTKQLWLSNLFRSR